MPGTTDVRCSRCLYDGSVPNLQLDSRGVCNYCHMHDALEQQYPTGAAGERELREIVDQIKSDGKRKPYDVIVGVSGGCDSSYLLYQAKRFGLRPLAVHFDNTWNSTIAVENIQNVLSKLDVDLHTHVVDNEEYDDIYRSFLKAGVRDVECPTDIGFASTLYRACEKYGVKYIFDGHAFRTEGMCPVGWLYIDGRYVRSVQKAFGTHALKTYPNMPLHTQLRWWTFAGFKRLRPLYYMDYHKEDAKQLLASELGWKWYGGHHLENRFTAFYWTYVMPIRFGIDGRLLGHSALVRSGQLDREEALDMLSEPVEYDPELVAMVKKRLGFSDEQFEEVMAQPVRTYREFKTYKTTFERWRWFFWMLARSGRIPQSFYMRYTLPDHTVTTETPEPLPMRPVPATAVPS